MGSTPATRTIYGVLDKMVNVTTLSRWSLRVRIPYTSPTCLRDATADIDDSGSSFSRFKSERRHQHARVAETWHMRRTKDPGLLRVRVPPRAPHYASVAKLANAAGLSPASFWVRVPADAPVMPL